MENIKIWERPDYFWAKFADGSLIEWERPQTYKQVCRLFKWYCQLCQCAGQLFCGDRLLHVSGTNTWADRRNVGR